MNKVAIAPVPAATGEATYHAVAGDKHSYGKTAGEALDAMTALLSDEGIGSLVVVVTRSEPQDLSETDRASRRVAASLRGARENSSLDDEEALEIAIAETRTVRAERRRRVEKP